MNRGAEMPRRRRTRGKNKKGRKLNARQKKEVKRLIGNRTETKYFDTTVGPVSVNTLATLSNISPITQGVGDKARVGDAVRVKKISINWSAIYADATNVMRMLLVQWKPNNAIQTPGLNDILEQGTVNSMYNFTNKADSFKVCYDKTFTFSANGTGAARGYKSIYGKKLHHQKLEFNPALATGFNNYYILWISDSLGTPHPTVSWTARVEFTDA